MPPSLISTPATGTLRGAADSSAHRTLMDADLVKAWPVRCYCCALHGTEGCYRQQRAANGYSWRLSLFWQELQTPVWRRGA